MKRLFDVVLSLVGLLLLSPVIFIAACVAAADTRSNGFFIQKRVGRHGRIFNLIKIRTMKAVPGVNSSITASNDIRITKAGSIFRRYKIDELPQLFNVVVGHMSLVGPRPDVQGYADRLIGVNRLILEVRPGITGPASLKYKNEEEILSGQSDAEKFNDEVIWPDKVNINLQYIREYSFRRDLRYILSTVFG